MRDWPPVRHPEKKESTMLTMPHHHMPTMMHHHRVGASERMVRFWDAVGLAVLTIAVILAILAFGTPLL